MSDNDGKRIAGEAGLSDRTLSEHAREADIAELWRELEALKRELQRLEKQMGGRLGASTEVNDSDKQ